MRILVTGGCGFIGTNLVRLLVSQGHQVLNLDKLTYAGNRRSLEHLEASVSYRLAVADICDAAQVTALVTDFRPDWIMHLAAESHVDRSIDGPGQFVQTNVVGTFNLFRQLDITGKSSKVRPDNDSASCMFPLMKSTVIR